MANPLLISDNKKPLPMIAATTQTNTRKQLVGGVYMNNISSELKKEIYAGTITSRDFAHDNGVSARTLRGLLRYDGEIKPVITMGRVHYYSLEELTKWLDKNKDRFTTVSDVSRLKLKDFYCTGCGVYTPNERKSTVYNCCTGCEKKANQARIDSRKNEKEEKKTITHAMKIKDKLDDFAAKRALDDLTTDSWMNEF